MEDSGRPEKRAFIPAPVKMEPEVPRPVAYVDRDGDLTFIVGCKEQHVVVDSRAVARSSTKFKAMFTGVSANSKPLFPTASSWKIKLPNENFEAVMIVMHVVHGIATKVPNQLPVKLLRPIFRFAQQFDMVRSLVDYGQIWVRNHTQSSEYIGGGITVPWVTWSLGLHRAFIVEAKTMAQTMYYRSKPNSSPVLYSVTGRQLRPIDKSIEECVGMYCIFIYLFSSDARLGTGGLHTGGWSRFALTGLSWSSIHKPSP